ncbi:MAG: Tat pathway signal protein [Phycisphaerales bacterium]|nr:Tat pathway signal protein [Phycisphaerales bacterium]
MTDDPRNGGLDVSPDLAGWRERTSRAPAPPSAAPVPVTIDGTRRAGRLSRREAMQWVLGTVAASALPPTASELMAQEVGRTPIPQERAARVPPRDAQSALAGYGTDPALAKVYKPGELWPLTFTDAQRRAATALADTIIPKDDLGPAASEVGVVEMIDEWASAPYPRQRGDRPNLILAVDWVDAEAGKRFGGKAFADLTQQQRHAICDDVCYAPKAKPEFKKAAAAFSLFRSLCAGAYYATPAGWQAIGYVGNVALPSFEGPPTEVLQKLGVTQTVA